MFAMVGCADTERPTRPGDNPIDPTNPTDPNDPNNPDTTTPDVIPPNVNFAKVSGIVWAPGNAPGMVPMREEIPVFGASVRLEVNRPEPIPQNAFCERCIDQGGWSTTSSHQGEFVLENVSPGTYWLVVEKGQFRHEEQIVLEDGAVVELTDAQTTLPGVHNPAEGNWVPRIALATGSSDELEDVIGKMGIGTVDSDGVFQLASGASAIDFYDNDGRDDLEMVGSLTDLVSDLSRMLQYHIIFIPCASGGDTSALQNQQVLRNIRDYVSAGGKLYVTDWSGEWHDNVFPEQVTLGDGEDTPADAYNRSNDTWVTSRFGDANGSLYTSENAEAADEDLFAWLNGQYGPNADEVKETFDASNMEFEGNWNTIEDLTSVQIGVDDEGLPVMDTPKAYIIGGNGNSSNKKPLTVTYEPTGCGRVLYSTYHTTNNSHEGLAPQERVLLYLIMEIGECKSGTILI